MKAIVNQYPRTEGIFEKFTTSSHINGLTVSSVCAYSLVMLITLAIFLDPDIFSVAHAGEGFYSIKIGSYRDLNNAVHRVESLKRSGRDAFYRQETINGKGDWYRVYVERYRSKEEAEKEAGRLKQLNMISGYYIRYVEDEGPPGRRPPNTGSPRTGGRMPSNSPSNRYQTVREEASRHVVDNNRRPYTEETSSNIGNTAARRHVEGGPGVTFESLPEKLRNLHIKKNFVLSSFKQVGIIHALRGPVVVVHRSSREAYYGREGDYIFENDSIYTLANSRCRIKFFNDDVATLAHDTEFSVENFVDEREKGKKRSVFSLLKGKAMFYAMRLFSYKEIRSKVKTPTVTMGIRGTKFGVHVYRMEGEKKVDRGIRVADSSDGLKGHQSALTPEEGESYTDCFSEDGYIDVNGKIIGPGEMFNGRTGEVVPTPPEVIKAFESETKVRANGGNVGEEGTEEEGGKKEGENNGGGEADEEEAEEIVVADTGEKSTPELFTEAMEEVTNITQVETVKETAQELADSIGLTAPLHGYFSLLLQKNSSPNLYDVFLPKSRQQLTPHADVYGYGINNTSDSVKYYQSEDSSDQEDLVDANLGVSSETGLIEPDGQRQTVGQYSYLKWGYDTYDKPFTFQVGGHDYEVEKIWWIEGNPAANSVVTNSKGEYQYGGSAYGSYSSQGNVSDMSGTFSGKVNFDSAQISDFNLNVSGDGHTASIQGATSSITGSQFTIDGKTGTWKLEGVEPGKKQGIGSFYGPEAKEIGGSWGMYISGPPAKGAGGIFAGQRR